MTPFEAQPAALDTSDSGALVRSLATQQPTTMVASMPEVGSQLPAAQEGDQTTAESYLPEVMQPTGLGSTEEEAPAVEAELPATQEPALQPQSDGTEQEVATDHPEPQAQLPTDRIARKSNQALKQPGALRNAINSIPTEDSAVDTSAGPRPQVELTGEANPQLNQTAQSEADASVGDAQVSADQETRKDFGEKGILPAVTPELMTVQQELTTPEAWQSQGNEGLPEMDAQLAAAVDAGILSQHQDELNAEMEKQAQAQTEFNTNAQAERDKGLADIEAENERVKQLQLAERERGEAEVQGHREEWQAQNEQVMADFDKSSADKRAQVEGDIQAKVAETDAKVEREYAAAEQKAQAETARAQSEVAAKQEEAKEKEKNKSWWDSVCDAVGDFFAALKEAVSAIFDALRAAVSAIIEGAKKLAGALIDMARDAIKGLISAFAEALKAFVKLALAAFPELAEKFCQWIDAAVEAMHKAIDALAEGLKAAVNALLDLVGAAINAILDAYEAYINAILDVLEALTVGFLRVMEGIANLVAAAKLMPEYLFWDEILKALLGTNPTEPIPGIERVGGPAAVQQPVNPEDPDQALLQKSELAESDVEFDQILGEEAISEEVMSELEEMEPGEYPFEGVPDPVTMDHFRNPDPESSPVQATDQEQDSGSGPDFANMSDDEKLNWYLNEMKGSSPESGGGESESPEGQQSEVPDVMKVGPLSVGQRMWFFGEQLKIGIQKWWDENKGWIIPSVILAVLAVVAALILTGGAALGPIFTGLMQALTVIFGAILAYQVAGHLWDYINKSWEGNTAEGGRSLATAFAIAMVELIFSLIFKGVGKLLKAIVKGAKSAIRGLGTLMRQSAKLAKKVGQAMLRNGKVFFRNVKASVLKGLRKLRDVTRRLTERLRLGRGVVRITAQWIIIELTFNPSKIVLRFRRANRRMHRESQTRLQGAELRGFRNTSEVMERLGNLKNRIKAIKVGDMTLDDAVAGIRGSSVTGTSSKGGLFRWERTDMGGKASDVDFFFHSAKLEQLLQRRGINLSGGKLSPEELMSIDPNLAKALTEFGEATSEQLGRSANAYFLSSKTMATLKQGEHVLR